MVTIGHLTSKLNSKTIPVLPFLDPSLMFHFNLLPSPVHPTGFSFISSQTTFSFLSCCHRTTNSHRNSGIVTNEKFMRYKSFRYFTAELLSFLYRNKSLRFMTFRSFTTKLLSAAKNTNKLKQKFSVQIC